MVPKDAWNALMGELSQKIEEINRLLVMFRSEQMRSLPAPAPLRSPTRLAATTRSVLT